MKTYSIFLTIITLTAASFASAPYPDAIKDAAIKIENVDSILEDAMVIGNGDINALVWSKDGDIKINLTKNDVWDARLLTHNDPPLPTIKRVKELGAIGNDVSVHHYGFILPEGYKLKVPDSYHAKPYPCPILCGELILEDPSKPFDNAKTASANLDIQKAVATLSTNNKPDTIVRALAQKNVFLIHTDRTPSLIPRNSRDVPPAKQGTKDGVMYLHKVLPPDLDIKGMELAIAVAQKQDLMTVAIVTSFESKNVVDAAIKLANDTLKQNVTKLIATHEKTWQKFWSKSGLTIDDPLLQRTWYRGLYFTRCIAKPGVQCPGLFASLIHNTPAWHGDYHTNYNIQQLFWGAYSANHPELSEPYDRLMKEYLPRAKWLAKQIYDIDGAYYPHVIMAYEPPNPEACKSVNGRQYIHHTWGMTLGVAGFTVQPTWWHYKYAPDKKFLKETAYPLVKEVATFYANFIDTCEGNGKVRLGPTVSPEHHRWKPNLSRNYDCAFDIAMFQYIFEAAIEGATTLNTDRKLVKRWQKALTRLPDYPTHNDQNKIVVDVAGADPIDYNISVPATPVFPADVITMESPKAQRELFKRTIDQLEWNGNNAAIMMAVSRARMQMPGTIDWIREEIQTRTRPNGTMTLNRIPHKLNRFGHYSEQFGTSIAVSEMLLQSVGDIIRVFPCYPKDKPASFENLRTQGGFLVSAKQDKNGNIAPIKITSTAGGTLRIKNPWKTIKATKNGKPALLKIDKKRIATIKTKPKDQITLTP